MHIREISPIPHDFSILFYILKMDVSCAIALYRGYFRLCDIMFLLTSQFIKLLVLAENLNSTNYPLQINNPGPLLYVDLTVIY